MKLSTAVLAARSRLARALTATAAQLQLPAPDFTIARPDDLLVVRFSFRNLTLHARGVGGNLQLVKEDLGAPSLIIATFPPQAVGEEIFRDPGPTSGEIARSRLAGPTRLVFQLYPVGAGGISYPYEFSLRNILYLCSLTDSLRVHPRAIAPWDASGILPADEPVAEPPADMTAIEMPYRLVLSPPPAAGWRHAAEPVTWTRPDTDETGAAVDVAWTELWHTRLISGRIGSPATARAIWTPDYVLSDDELAQNRPFAMPLEPRDRKDLVRLMFEPGATAAQTRQRLSRAINVDRLMLSALGAWLRSTFETKDDDISLEAWANDAVAGRDQFVKIVRRGYLYPWGHEATYTRVTERKIGSGPPIAYLLFKEFLVVREATKLYATSDNPFRGRQMFPTVTLHQPHPLEIVKPDTPEANDWFWVADAKGLLRLDATAEDGARNAIAFAPGAIFIDSTIVDGSNPRSPAVLDAVRRAYHDAAFMRLRDLDFAGQRTVLARAVVPTSTEVAAERIVFSSAHNGQGRPSYHPVIDRATVQVPAINELTGRPTATEVTFAERYLQYEFASAENAGEVFLELLTPVRLDLFGTANTAGLFVTPAIHVVALSALTGVVGGRVTGDAAEWRRSIDEFATGSFNPRSYFDRLTFFGVHDALPFIPAVSLESLPATVPRIETTTTPGAGGATTVTRFSWAPAVTQDGRAPANLNLVLERITGAGAPITTLTCTLRNFVLDSAAAAIGFESVRFESRTGAAPLVETKTFPAGPATSATPFGLKQDLRFVNGIMPMMAMTSGKPVDVSIAEGIITINLRIRAPEIKLGGIFTVHNLSLSFLLSIGYLGTQTGIEMKFADRNDPCVLTVGPFFGRAYYVFSASLIPACIPSIDAGFEFGASINLGVLSASASAGIFWELNTSRAFSLTGYIQCHGAVNLGFFSAGVWFRGELHLDTGGNVYCHVELRIEVSLFMFSLTITIGVTIRFAGAPSAVLVTLDGRSIAAGDPPRFGEVMSKQQWRRYCEAFA